MTRAEHIERLPGKDLTTAKMPGHWLLARLGKRVLRPGGIESTRALLDDLAIGFGDRVVEFAPGLGITARLILEKRPTNYIGVERDPDAAQWTSRHLADDRIEVAVGAADSTGLPSGSASVVLGEAMLSMNTQAQKQRIVAEAFRLLCPGGRYGIHELAIVPDELPCQRKEEINRALSAAIHVGARPLDTLEWTALMEGAGFRVLQTRHVPMDLLRPTRLIEDEGLLGAFRIAGNILRDGAARRRVMAMRRVFEQYRENLGAISLVAQKPWCAESDLFG